MKREHDPEVETVQVLQIKFNRGEGTPDNIIRVVTQYRWPDGRFIAEIDPCPDGKPKDARIRI